MSWNIAGCLLVIVGMILITYTPRDKVLWTIVEKDINNMQKHLENHHGIEFDKESK